MAISRKYGRTYHFPFSPGTTSDDRINHQYWNDICCLKEVVHTEKLDGENNCLSRHGVFARSHAAPTTSPWTHEIRAHWELIKDQLGNLEIFGENLYAIHSIAYKKLEHHFYVFGVREGDQWLSWEETKFYAALLGFPTVPELTTVRLPQERATFEAGILQLAGANSRLGSFSPYDDNQPCTMEGIVTRSTSAYTVDDFAKHVFKYVRKGHVKTDEHWTRNWKRAKLKWEWEGPGS